MNITRILLCIAAATFIGACTQSKPQNSVPTTTEANESIVSIKVLGNCEMCQERIIEAATNIGVIHPKWTPETQTFFADLTGTTLKANQVSEVIAAVGHDTELTMAPDAAYNNLPDCCRYQRLLKVKAINIQTIEIKATHEASVLNIK